VGLRPRYYSDDGEDALIMTTEPLDAPAMRARIDAIRHALDAAAPPEPPAGWSDEPPAGDVADDEARR